MRISTLIGSFSFARAYAAMLAAQADEQANALISTGLNKQRIKLDYYYSLSELQSEIKQALNIVKRQGLITSPSVLKKLKRLGKLTQESQELDRSDTFMNIIGLRNEEYRHIFTYALGEIDRQANDNALSLLLLLALLNPFIPLVWVTMAQTLETQDKTWSAVMAYAMAGYLENGDINLALQTAHLLVENGQNGLGATLLHELADDLLNTNSYQEHGLAIREMAQDISKGG